MHERRFESGTQRPQCHVRSRRHRQLRHRQRHARDDHDHVSRRRPEHPQQQPRNGPAEQRRVQLDRPLVRRRPRDVERDRTASDRGQERQPGHGRRGRHDHISGHDHERQRRQRHRRVRRQLDRHDSRRTHVRARIAHSILRPHPGHPRRHGIPDAHRDLGIVPAQEHRRGAPVPGDARSERARSDGLSQYGVDHVDEPARRSLPTCVPEQPRFE